MKDCEIQRMKTAEEERAVQVSELQKEKLGEYTTNKMRIHKLETEVEAANCAVQLLER